MSAVLRYSLTAPVFPVALCVGLCMPMAALAQTNGVLTDGASSSSGAVEEIVVTGRGSTLYSVNQLSSSKLPTDTLLSTQTVQVINEQLMADMGARDAQDLYRNLSSVSFFSYAGVTARGFRQEENFYDGLRGDPYAGFSVPQLFNIERMEYLKGPSGMLYGSGAPGGLFNYITKKPSQEFALEVNAVAGSESRRGASMELNGALSRNTAGRLGVFHETRDLPRDNADSGVDIYDGGFTVNIPRGQIILQATRYEQDLGGNRLRGIPADNNGFFLADRRWNHNEASDFLKMSSDVLQARIELELADNLQWDAAVRRNEGEEAQQYHEPSGLFDSDGDGVIDASRRQFRDQFRSNSSWSLGSNLVWSHSAGQVDNRTLAGVDMYRNDAWFQGASLSGGTSAQPGLPTPLSLRNPAYGMTFPGSYNLPPLSAYSITDDRQQRAGFYLLNESTIGDLIAVVGVRQDRFEDTNRVSHETFDDKATTWRTGLVYRVRDDVSLFAQWAQSFEPQSVSSQNPERGGPFDPVAGEIYEAGVRTALGNGRIQSSASVYRIVRENILQTHPQGDINGDGLDDLIALGEVTSEGIELDVTMDITPNWVATASYAYNDARITATAGTNAVGNSVGDRFANAPEHQFGFWSRYQIPVWNLALALGGDYVGDRVSLSNQKVRSYLVFDASVIYEAQDWRLLLRINNLTDKTYAASGFVDRSGHFPGAPRAVFAEITRRW